MAEPVDRSNGAVEFIAGSHKWPKMVLPVRWLSDQNFYAGENDYIPVPDPDGEPDKYNVLEWEMEPGDAVAVMGQFEIAIGSGLVDLRPEFEHAVAENIHDP